ncbi:hypothetical protein AYL99_06548 [Fonsecaea erecta]|uniref:Uncharacterized protein n=1 Tax=Fonsecaea erecta TaxID=1367422 RepID=A0A178ZHI9_9EURO|nr:hypothetical protein AYL99_06548 [Fonsecaea erecta]OAP59250.1 hypothetical protein AYL99_06548 [Fonsecaea erecta]
MAADGSRTLRTRRSELHRHDMDPSELAQLSGYTHIYNMLRPNVGSVTSYRTRATGKGFLTLIINDLGAKRVMEQHIRLPELEVLTESDGNLMWFPIRDHGFENALSPTSVYLQTADR